ncbi:MAG: membrane-bound alpha-1,6- mannosyltransferase Initiation-specific [Phylliscum demangeonii]|nr:MAG: membrane-bound alpha-1,6- mannosyltransferase Initiation-specific [Phylliscum demangeonii]
MTTFRRALVIAALVFTGLYLLRTSPSMRDGEPAAEAESGRGSLKAGARIHHNPTSAWKSAARPVAHGGEVAAATAGTAGGVRGQQTLAGTRTLRDQLADQFPYDVASKFPNYIWQTWKTTPASGEFPEAFRPAEASWTEKHRTFVHEVVTDAGAVALVRYLYSSVPAVVEAYEALPLPILKADFFRYLILLARGGIYSDIDTAALKSAVDWLPASVGPASVGLVVGIEADPDRADWAQWYSRRIQFCQWTIQAKAGHPVLVDVVAAITRDTLSRRRAATLTAHAVASVVEFTGPAQWTDRIFDYLNDARFFEVGAAGTAAATNITWQNFTGMRQPKQVGDVVVLPITAFSPGVQQMGAGEPDDPMACVKHDFQGTWKPESERHIGEQRPELEEEVTKAKAGARTIAEDAAAITTTSKTTEQAPQKAS